MQPVLDRKKKKKHQSMQGVNEWKPYRPIIRKKTQETEKRRKSETSHLRTLSRAAQGDVCVCKCGRNRWKTGVYRDLFQFSIFHLTVWHFTARHWTNCSSASSLSRPYHSLQFIICQLFIRIFTSVNIFTFLPLRLFCHLILTLFMLLWSFIECTDWCSTATAAQSHGFKRPCCI